MIFSRLLDKEVGEKTGGLNGLFRMGNVVVISSPFIRIFLGMELGAPNWIIFGFQKCNKFCKKIIDFPFSVALLFREPLENALEIVSTNKLKKI